MPLRLPAFAQSLLPFGLPILAILLARLLTFTSWAEDNAGWAALLFAWIVADSLVLGVMARAKKRHPEAFSVAAALALAGFIILFGAATPVRAVYFDWPAVLIAAAGTLAIFLAWSVYRVGRSYRASRSLISASETVLPRFLVSQIASQLRTLWLALFRWNAPVEVPHGAHSFIYHTYLTPMIATFLALQVIEISVVHLLLLFLNPTLAWVLFALGIWGFIWTVALLKSFRIYPVLLSKDGVRARLGMVHDLSVPFEAISDIQTPFSSEELESRSVLNCTILSAPNVSLRFARPITIPAPFGRERRISGVALRLDDSGAFMAALKEKLAEHRAIGRGAIGRGAIGREPN